MYDEVIDETHLTFGKEFTQAVELKQVAQQEAERAKFLVEKAEQEKKAAVISADGDASAATLLAKAFGDAGEGLVELRRIEASEDIAYSESVAVTDLEYDAQSDTERNDAGRVYYEENEPQIVMGSYMFEPEYEVDEQVLAEPEVQQEDLALLQNMDW
ncbi:Protein l(2)37Cc [Chionoecetes opilio]|uniref:Prohibitin n=1 Tax=Chionoecetes opilio TaxID=41210 RepID=A0A8J4Y832_CHIOP|nr:Protein l(2)37Cc [Chionoecetes opilio]